MVYMGSRFDHGSGVNSHAVYAVGAISSTTGSFAFNSSPYDSGVVIGKTTDGDCTNIGQNDLSVEVFTVDEDLIEVSLSWDAAGPVATGYSEDNSIDLTI